MSHKRRANENEPDGRDHAAPERDLHDAMRALGWVVPECDADVARAEDALSADPVALPEALQDARAVFEGRSDPSRAAPARLPLSGSRYIDATLARAAREGGTITPEVEQTMRRDREAAERDAQDGKTNPSA